MTVVIPEVIRGGSETPPPRRELRGSQRFLKREGYVAGKAFPGAQMLAREAGKASLGVQMLACGAGKASPGAQMLARGAGKASLDAQISGLRGQ